LFKSSVFDAYADDKVFDLAEVMGKLVREKQLAGYEVPERFYEMGSPAAWRIETLLQSNQHELCKRNFWLKSSKSLQTERGRD